MESKLVPSTPSSLYRPFPGDYCLALFHADHSYHRAYVEAFKEGKYRVFFVDFGNRTSLSVEDMRPLTYECISLPAQAVPCSLEGFVGKEWSFEECMSFSSLVLEKKVAITVKVRERERGEGRERRKKR